MPVHPPVAVPSVPASGPNPLFSLDVRVYYEDTDAGGVVYHATYLRWYERARSDWLRAVGVLHRELAQRDGTGFVVRSMQIDFLRAARLDDRLRVDVAMASLGRASADLVQHTWLIDPDGQARTCINQARVRIALIRFEASRAVAFPPDVLNAMRQAAPLTSLPADA